MYRRISHLVIGADIHTGAVLPIVLPLRGIAVVRDARTWFQRPNVRVNRHFAEGRVWARLLEPKLGPPQSVRLNDQLGSTAPALNEPTVGGEHDG